MSEIDDKISLLQLRLDDLSKVQTAFQKEVRQIEYELFQLRQARPFQAETPPTPPVREYVSPSETEQTYSHQQTNPPPIQPVASPNYGYQTSENAYYQQDPPKPKSKSNTEEFIGRNLISLIGIIITVIGVAIGAKYAIDRDLISPSTRIIAGYLFAFATLGIAVWLKAKYHNFSAVLLSGAMAMMYFLTFFAYSFYNLIPQPTAFLIMLLITAFTVAAAINYSRQVIAHIGLVGAYAVPFLLSDGSGRVAVLFGYMTIVNFGILIVSVKKFWKPLYYSSFIFTWIIFSAWYFAQYNSAEHFTLAFAFSAIFFATFYLTFVSYKLIAQEEFNAEIVLLILINSFIFYGFGCSILAGGANGGEFLGLFTVANSIVHFFVAVSVDKYKLGGNLNLYLPVALSLTFLTISFPVQSGGDWITIFWIGEALFLFIVGRTKRLAILEVFSYPLMLLASLSLLSDWAKIVESSSVLIPFVNNLFLTSAVFTIAFAAICYINKREENLSIFPADLQKIINFVLPAIFLVVLYNTFRTEIGNYFHGEIVRTAVPVAQAVDSFSRPTSRNSSLLFYNVIWQINYSMLFLTILSFINIRKQKSRVLGFINIALNALVIFIFLTAGLYFIRELRENYLSQANADFFNRGTFHLIIRYVSYIFAAGLIAATYKYFKCKFLRDAIPEFSFDFVFDVGFYFTTLWIFSSELLNLMDIFRVGDSYKLGLSILWGIYALGLIVLGIYQRKKHLRIGAIVLFAVILVKLFFYDIADLDTISKTIVFVSLGVLLLLISFLYNKFTDAIFENNENRERETGEIHDTPKQDF